MNATYNVVKGTAATNATYNGHSMVGVLHRVLVCSPKVAGWDDPQRTARWQELGFLHPPEFATARSQHDALCSELQSCGAEVLWLPPAGELTLDAVYAHDASLLTDYGAICLHTGKPNRVAEAQRHRGFYCSLGIPLLGEVRPPGTAEAGDIVWLDARTLLVGRGYRTNAAGIEQLRALLAPHGVEVISAPLPYGAGPTCCLHLMSLISLLGERAAVVDMPWLAVETVDLLCKRDFRFVEIDPTERNSLACNVLALGQGRLLALEENQRTNQRLRQAGFEVRTFSGSELCINGGGGPTCLTRPVLRG